MQPTNSTLSDLYGHHRRHETSQYHSHLPSQNPNPYPHRHLQIDHQYSNASINPDPPAVEMYFPSYTHNHAGSAYNSHHASGLTYSQTIAAAPPPTYAPDFLVQNWPAEESIRPYGSTPYATMTSNENDNASKFSLQTLLNKDKLNGSNYLEWFRNLRIVLKFEKKLWAIEQAVPDLPAGSNRAARDEHQQRLNDSNEVACLMLATMVPELQKNLENLSAFDMANQLKDMFQEQARQERFDTVKALMGCKLKDGSSVSVHVLEMKAYFDHLERLGFPISREISTDIILNSLTSSYSQFIQNYNMNNLDKTIMELHSMLKTAESNMVKSKVSAAPVLAIKDRGVKRKKPSNAKGKGKGNVAKTNSNPKPKVQAKSDIPECENPKEAICFHCKDKGHFKRSCPKYLEELKELKKNKANGASTSGTKGK